MITVIIYKNSDLKPFFWSFAFFFFSFRHRAKVSQTFKMKFLVNLFSFFVEKLIQVRRHFNVNIIIQNYIMEFKWRCFRKIIESARVCSWLYNLKKLNSSTQLTISTKFERKNYTVKCKTCQKQLCCVTLYTYKLLIN